MDYATLTDNTGRKADFRNIILIMTTNAGAREMENMPVGFMDGGDSSGRSVKAVESTFSPEFRNRLDAMIPFRSLTPDLMGRIVDKAVAEMVKGLDSKRVRLILTPEAREWLATKGFDPRLGARPLQRLIRAELEDELANLVLFGSLEKGGKVLVHAQDAKAERLTFTVEVQQKARIPELELLEDEI
jgi:ATP-dependent Clp protease ATP-binding subunit ClpA